jgi:enamine deaminase RidA (YjgF/YER057c/UK114 family)
MPTGINPPNVWQPTGKFSLAVVEHEGKRIHFCGQGSIDENGRVIGVGDIRVQTRETLKNIEKVCSYFGGRMEDIISICMYVTNIGHLDAVHEVRGEFFSAPYPVSSLVEVSSFVYPEMLIEIVPIAVVPLERYISRDSD